MIYLTPISDSNFQENFKKKMAEKDKQAKDMVQATEKKYTQREAENKKQIQALEKKNKELAAGGGAVRGAVVVKVSNWVQWGVYRWMLRPDDCGVRQ